MNEELLLERLETLAMVIGSTLEALWPSILNNIRITAAGEVVVQVMFWVVTYKFTSLMNAWRKSEEAYDEEGRTMVFTASLAAVLILGGIMALLIPSDIAALFYPEPAAISKLMRALK